MRSSALKKIEYFEAVAEVSPAVKKSSLRLAQPTEQAVSSDAADFEEFLSQNGMQSVFA